MESRKTSNLTIGDPASDDLDAILALWMAQYALHHKIDPDYYVASEREAGEDRVYLEKAMAQHAPILKIAKVNRQVVGFITFDRAKAAYLDTKIQEYVEVKELFVLEDARGQDIGTKLMNEAHNYAKTLGLSHIMVQYSAHNSGASAFYQKLGFQPSQIVAFRSIHRQ